MVEMLLRGEQDMRHKDWLAQVLCEASERVNNWPDWKKSPELTHTIDGDREAAQARIAATATTAKERKSEES